jgi:hypothetical protein
VRWLGLWVVLTLAYAAGWAAARLCGQSGASTVEELAALGAVPLVQLVALAVLVATRRRPGPPADGD